MPEDTNHQDRARGGGGGEGMWGSGGSTNPEHLALNLRVRPGDLVVFTFTRHFKHLFFGFVLF